MFVSAYLFTEWQNDPRMNKKNKPNLEETKNAFQDDAVFRTGRGLSVGQMTFLMSSEGSVQHLFCHPHPFFP